MLSFLSSLAIISLVSYLLHIYPLRRQRHPPGPHPLPLVGNVLDFPRYKAWITFAGWKKQYGDVVYMNILGMRIIVLNSLKACNELVGQRSIKYSGRPRSVMLNELMGWDFVFGTMNYSLRWRQHRQLFHQHFNEHAVRGYRPKQIRGVRHFLLRLLEDPDKFLEHCRLLFGETILDIIYDIQVKDAKSVYIQTPEQAIQASLLAAIPGQFLVDAFPILKYIPSWFPGAAFKRNAAVWRELVLGMKDLPFTYVMKQMENGTARPSVLTSMLAACEEEATKEGSKLLESPEETARSCAGVAYAGGADTTLSTIQTIFMTMANNPEIQKAAQKELDALLEDKRFPIFEDEPHLPIVTAIVKELTRWHNVAPFGLPRMTMEDDEYNGYLIPKGTTVLMNIWAILHDPDMYPNPMEFNPRRWLIDTPEGLKINPAVPDTEVAGFGFGRRICPGRHFATSALFITIASVLTCFDVKPLDVDGNPAQRVDENFTGALLSYPLPYKVSIIPRSNRIVQLLKDELVE